MQYGLELSLGKSPHQTWKWWEQQMTFPTVRWKTGELRIGVRKTHILNYILTYFLSNGNPSLGSLLTQRNCIRSIEGVSDLSRRLNCHFCYKKAGHWLTQRDTSHAWQNCVPHGKKLVTPHFHFMVLNGTVLPTTVC